MTTQPSSDTGPIRRAFEREYFTGTPEHARERNASGEYKYMASQIAWTNFRYGWLAAMREASRQDAALAEVSRLTREIGQEL